MNGSLSQHDQERLSTPYRDGPPEETVYLVTGASRGIGRGLIEAFLQRPKSTVVAWLRNVRTATPALSALTVAEGSRMIIVQLNSDSETDAQAAVQTLREEHGVTHLDVVVANAAMATNFGPASTMPLEHLQAHMMVNMYAPVLLFQATRLMLQQSKQQAKFVLIGAPISTITNMHDYSRAPLTAYGVSKLAANYMVRKFHFENKWLTAFIIDPGHVQTDMGDQGARLMGRPQAPTTVADSVAGICARIDEATKETTSGHFVIHTDGSQLPW
uniref:Norsolorinic acid ketoreductase n=1 Tax=Aspergillus parasiticus (strain ATCC 56775 / NRRL 5862 / SRRC 143 / SU-1) TaxID=1403190 RepID=AFLD_ASPPU|nr:RecName: Full=Norsolorinic acid ketoreductase; AltName: Full=Aflatoxin biosynthesis ketoreductase nor-1; AltName: Full=Aflatoxin biosynthesis protein D; AltName: Full=Short chain dehydrogenase aflD [Aspergillus parasiticus SU-1]AAA58798.1 norsolornic acid [Aspergillus parasiticus]AAS66005.1 norsolorinic acid reductase [Aspergillus parasiticus]